MSNDNEPTSDRLCCHCGKVTKDHEFFQRDDERKWWVHFECITTISRQCVLDGDDFDRKLEELFPSVMGHARNSD